MSMLSKGTSGLYFVLIVLSFLLLFGTPTLLKTFGLLGASYDVIGKGSEMKNGIEEVCNGGSGDFKQFALPPLPWKVYCDDCSTLKTKALVKTTVGGASAALNFYAFKQGLSNFKNAIKSLGSARSSFSSSFGSFATGIKNWQSKMGVPFLTTSDWSKLTTAQKTVRFLGLAELRTTATGRLVEKQTSLLTNIHVGFEQLGEGIKSLNSFRKFASLNLLSTNGAMNWYFLRGLSSATWRIFIMAEVDPALPSRLAARLEANADSLIGIATEERLNIPVGFDETLIVRKSADVSGELRQLDEDQKLSIAAARATSAWQELNANLISLFTLLGHQTYAAVEFSPGNARGIGSTLLVSEQNDQTNITLRFEHTFALLEDWNTYLDDWLEANRDRISKERQAAVVEKMSQVSLVMIDGTQAGSIDPWNAFYKGLTSQEFTAAMKDACEGLDCTWFVDAQQTIKEINANLVDLRSIQRQLVAGRNRALEILKSSSSCEKIPEGSYSFAKCAVIVSCGYDDQVFLNEKSCLISAVNVENTKLTIDSTSFRIYSFPLGPQPLEKSAEWWQVYIPGLAGVFSRTFGEGLYTGSVVLKNCGEPAENQLVFCIKNSSPAYSLPGFQEVCFTASCATKVSCESRPATSALVENSGGQTLLSGAVFRFGT